MRILAVDDEPFILELIPKLAARIGFPDVTTVASGALAMEALLDKDVTFDCLVLDINMPGMDGIELCSKVRQIPFYRRAPIIMLTAMSERDFIDAAFKAGATDYATKPFDINELGARLRVAQELVLARRISDTANAAREASAHAAERMHPFDLSEPILLNGVNDLIDFQSFSNYLKQSSRAGLAASQVIAVKTDRIEEVYACSKTDEFLYALDEVANAVTEALRTQGCLISYAGKGVFVVVSNSATPLSARAVESDVQHLLDEKNSEYDNGNPMDLQVSIGSPIQPNFGDLAAVPRSVERAIARAESRSETRRDEPRAVNIRVLGC